MTWHTIRDHVELRLPHVILRGSLNYSTASQGLVLLEPSGESEVLSVDLLSGGYLAAPCEVLVKDWSEHTGMAAALVAAGVAEQVGEPIALEPFSARAVRLRLIAAPAVQEARHER